MEKVQKKVQVWIYSRNAEDRLFYFLLLRTRPDRGQFWQPVTGSVEEGEGLVEAALREAKEESGLNWTGSMTPIGEPFEYESRGRHVVEYPFAIEAHFQFPLKHQSDWQVILDLNEHSDYRWVQGQEALNWVAYPSNAEVLKLVMSRLCSMH